MIDLKVFRSVREWVVYTTFIAMFIISYMQRSMAMGTGYFASSIPICRQAMQTERSNDHTIATKVKDRVCVCKENMAIERN